MVEFTPVIVDTSHYEVIEEDGWNKAREAGILGMITKASQGAHYADPTYGKFVTAARAAGLLVGGYHFNSAEDPRDQVDWFLHVISPNDDPAVFANTLLALDYEDNPRSDMSIRQAVQFLHYLEEQVGRKAVIYSGNKLKESIGRLNEEDLKYVTSHKLWLAQYGPRAVLPKGFDRWWIHQYTGDGFGPRPHWIPGIKCPGNKGLDLNRYYSDDTSTLAAEWLA